MLSLRHLNAMVFIGGLLSVGLGLIAAFQVDDGAAHNGSYYKTREVVTGKSSYTRIRYENKPRPFCGKLRRIYTSRYIVGIIYC